MAEAATAPAALVAADRLRAFAVRVLVAVGVPEADADLVADALVAANLEGVDTHGVSRLAIYTRRVRAGLINPRPHLRWTHPAPALADLDADNALGPVAATTAVDEAVRLAKAEGVGMVIVAHTNHAAAFSTYTERAARQGCVAFLVGNTPPAMLPAGGTTAFLGTNPLAFAAPGPSAAAPPIVVDMATTLVARGNIIMAARQGQPIPAGWAVDREGRPTTDAQAALGGALLPMAGGKGYALALMIEVLAGVLSGAGWGPHVRSPYDDWTAPTDAGLWCLAFDLAPLLLPQAYSERLGALLDELRAAPAAPGERIRVPGERRAALRAERSASGIPLDTATVAELAVLADEIGVAPLECDAPT
jgi:LDH2 family malate/lactate/ureidoglycolate dehydrogenase